MDVEETGDLMSSNMQDETQLTTSRITRLRRSRNTATKDPNASEPLSPNPFAEFGDDLAYPAVDPFAPEMDFRVDLNTFRGPLDLLLYLVRKHEVDIMNIPIAMITDQYVGYLDVLTQLDVDEVGDFVEMASLLIEIKSRMVLPQAEDESAEEMTDDPRDELVLRLLEYKKYKDVASILKETGHEWQQRYPRLANDLPTRKVDKAEQPIQEVELWDLVSAIGRIMREKHRLKPLTNIVYDDTPMQVYMQRIHERLIQDGSVSFTDMFEAGMHKANLIGIFLAILELARNYGVVVDQSGLHGHMVLRQGPDFKPSLEVTEVFGEFDGQAEVETVPAKPR